MRHHAVTPSSERERLAAAFRAALYRIDGPSGPIDLRIGRRSAALDRLLERAGVRCWAFLTAVNPGARRADAEENSSRLARFDAELADHGFAWLAGVSRDPSGAWPAEPSRLVLQIDAEAARALARKWGQLALLTGEAGAAVHLQWVTSAADGG